MKSWFLTFLFATVLGFAQSPSDSAYIEFQKPSQDFGDLYQEDSVKLEYTFTNTGSKYLVLSGVYTTCGCTTPVWSKDSIAPGKSGVIVVKFNSKDKIGRQNKTVTIYSNAKNTPARIILTGNVLPGKKKKK